MTSLIKKTVKTMAIAGAAACTTMALATPASAATVVYNAVDYTGGNHGLWTNNYNPNGTGVYYSFTDMIYTFDTVTMVGVLTGTATNAGGDTAAINITFSDFAETHKYKKENGIAYDEATDSPDIDFLTSAVGTITIDGMVFNLSQNPFAGGYAFQYGTGANAKNATDYGASAWLMTDENDRHWDLNFQLVGGVPEPTTWALLILGFAGIGGAMRRKNGQAKELFAMAPAR